MTLVDQRINQMSGSLKRTERWILLGSLCGWGDGLDNLKCKVLKIKEDVEVEKKVQRVIELMEKETSI